MTTIYNQFSKSRKITLSLCVIMVALVAFPRDAVGASPRSAIPLATFIAPTTGYMGTMYLEGGHLGIDVWYGHTDIDPGNPPGNNVYAVYPGTVYAIYYENRSNGQWIPVTGSSDPNWAKASVVVLQHSSLPGGTRYTLYLHLANDNESTTYISSSLYVGKPIYQGDYLGRMGNWRYYGYTGAFTHLHFEITDSCCSLSRTRYDPSSYLGFDVNYNNINVAGHIQRGDQFPPGGGSPPAAPTNQHLVSTTSTSVTIGWTDASNNESGFNIYRSTGGSFTYYTNTAANQQTFTDYGVACGSTYYYKVSSYNSAGESGLPTGWITAATQSCGSGTDDATLVADVTVPDGTVMSPGQSFTKIWQMRNSGTTTWSSGYTLNFLSGSQMSAPSYVTVASTSPNNTVNISVNMVAPTTPGTYTGYWRMNNAQGAYFGQTIWVQIVVTGGSAPSTPSSPNPSDGATLSRTSDTWLYWNTNGTSCDVHIWGGSINITPSGGCSSLYLGPMYGGSYQWQVTARNLYGTTTGSTWHFNIRPYPPTSLSASTVSQTQINLSWTKSTDDPGSVDGYKVYYSNGSYIDTVSAGTQNYLVGNLSCGSSYSFYVKAVRQGVESDATNTIPASTQSCTPVVPNDDFGNPTLITNNTYNNTQDTSGATSATDDPSLCAGGVGGHSVWYRFTPGSSGTLSVNTIGSNYDTVLAVWLGTRGSLSRLACDDDSGGNLTSSLSATLGAGTAYYIEVTAYGTTTGGNLMLSVNFSPTQCYSLTTSVNPTGSGTIDASPAPNCNGTQYTSGTSVTLTANPNSGYTFSSWSGNASGSSSTTTVAMSGNRSVTGNFSQTSVQGCSPGNGTVTLAISPSALQVQPNQTFNLAIQVQTGSGQTSGIGTGLIFDPSLIQVIGVTPGNTLNVVLANSYDNNAGTIRYDAGTFGSPPSGSFTLVTFQFQAQSSSGVTTLAFNCSQTMVAAVDGPYDILGSATNSTITIGTAPTCYTLTTLVSPGASGSVNAVPAPNCNNGTQYTSGTSVTLTANANSGYAFDYWSGDASGTSNPVIIVLNGNRTVTTNFKNPSSSPTWIFLPFISK